MKYNTLLRYRDFLISKGLSTSTALTYYKAVCYLLDGQYLMDCRNLDIEAVLDKLRRVKYKGQYSKYKNAFLKLCAFLDIKLSTDTRLELDTMLSTKKRQHRKLKPVKLSDIQRHINRAADEKLRLSLETMLYTGLRVSELAGIKKEDCTILNGRIKLSFIGKGGGHESAYIDKAKDSRFFEALLSFINEEKTSEKIFYLASYLQAKALEKGFCTHDLRRAFAKVTYGACKDIDTVRQLLRHSKLKNTRLYLRSKVEI